MVNVPQNRRTFCLAALGFAGLAASGLRAEEIADLSWGDLLPKGEVSLPPSLQGVLDHDAAPLVSQQSPSTGVRTDWNGKTVRMNGFIVPLDYKGTGVTVFLLVPYVGACIHVPPPPANQLVLVTTEKPFEADGLFDPVTVTGMFGTASTSTQLADVGYALSADRIERYRG